MKLVVCLVAVCLVASAMAVNLQEQEVLEADPRVVALLEMIAGPAQTHQSSKGPAGKLPAAPSDKNKQSKDGNSKEAPASAKKSKAASIKNAATSAKKVTAKITGAEHISLVPKPTWEKVKRAKKGEKIEALIKEIGGNFVKKVQSFFKRVWDTLKKLNPFGFASTSASAQSQSVAASKICHWVMSIEDTFNSGARWSGSSDSNADWATYKPGGCYIGSNVNRQNSDGYNCFSGDTAKSQPVTGSTSANANLICVDKDNTMVDPPGNCRANVNFYGAYQGRTYSTSDSMWVCPLGSRHIQVTAAHEAQLQIGSAIPAAKGLVTTTGNSITETYTFQFSAGAQGGTNKDGPSASANVAVSFGYTVVEQKDFGEKENLIAIQHQNTYPVPFNAILQTIASAQINGAGRVWGSASAASQGFYMCLAATSTNCGMPNSAVEFGLEQSGSGILSRYQAACAAMKRTANIN
jgi:hypothetical protein